MNAREETRMKTTVLPVLLLFAACGGEPPDHTAGKEIADDYREALDEAAAVQDQVDAGKERVDAALDDADGKDVP